MNPCRSLLGATHNDLLPTAADIALTPPGLTQDLLRRLECGTGQMLRIETIPPYRVALLRSFDSS